MIRLVSPAATNNRSRSASVRLLLFLRLYEAGGVATKHANFDVLFLGLSCTRGIRWKDEITVIFNVSPDFISTCFTCRDIVLHFCLSTRYLIFLSSGATRVWIISFMLFSYSYLSSFN